MRQIFLNKLTEAELGYVIGMVNGDGYFYYEPNFRHYTVEVYLHSEKDKDIQAFFISLLDKINAKVNIYKDKRFACNRLRIRSKQLYEMVKNSDKIMLTAGFCAGFISGMIDSDGYVMTRKRTAVICNTNKKLINSIVKSFSFLGIKVTPKRHVYKDRNWSILYRIHVPVEFINSDNNSIKLKRLKIFQQRSGSM